MSVRGGRAHKSFLGPLRFFRRDRRGPFFFVSGLVLCSAVGSRKIPCLVGIVGVPSWSQDGLSGPESGVVVWFGGHGPPVLRLEPERVVGFGYG